MLFERDSKIKNKIKTSTQVQAHKHKPRQIIGLAGPTWKLLKPGLKACHICQAAEDDGARLRDEDGAPRCW